MVNSLGMPFNLGTIFAFILIVGAFHFGLNYTKKKVTFLQHPIFATFLS